MSIERKSSDPDEQWFPCLLGSWGVSRSRSTVQEARESAIAVLGNLASFHKAHVLSCAYRGW